MKRIVASMVAASLYALAGSLALAGSAFADPSSTETITSVVQVTSFPSAPPYAETYSWTFTTSTGDSGSESVQVLFFAVPLADGRRLPEPEDPDEQRWTEHARRALQRTRHRLLDPPVPNSTGSCVVLAGTAAYSGQHGSSPLSGTVLFDTSGTSVGTVTDTLATPS